MPTNEKRGWVHWARLLRRSQTVRGTPDGLPQSKAMVRLGKRARHSEIGHVLVVHLPHKREGGEHEAGGPVGDFA